MGVDGEWQKCEAVYIKDTNVNRSMYTYRVYREGILRGGVKREC